MRDIIKTSCLALLSFSFPSARACDGGFLPPNNLRIPATDKARGLSYSQFHAVIDKVEKLYGPEAKADGAELKIDRWWNDPTVNAGTYRDADDRHWHVNLYGGFARHPDITQDGFTLVICHEIGHHLGGAPKKLSTQYAKWSSNEGQADYFGTLKCLRRLFERENNLDAIKELQIPDAVKDSCSKAFSHKEAAALCMRTSMAGLSVAYVMSRTQRTPALPSFETPNLEEISTTREEHPQVQCRLDTYFQGSLCEVDFKDTVSQSDEVKGTCHQSLGHTIGSRPRCWFNPTAIK